jgi:predicted nucleic acid-binding protein
MTVYFDSSALVAVYVTEAYSARARRELRKHSRVPWTLLHDLEVRNALRLLHGRRHIEEPELHGLIGHIDDDLRRGRLARPVIDLAAAFRRAEELSRKHASTTLARTLDVLHVAALIEIGCETLVSGDERQITLAKAEGLRALDIRAGT